MAAYSFPNRGALNSKIPRARYNMTLDEVEEELASTVPLIPSEVAAYRREIRNAEGGYCQNSPNPYSVLGTCLGVYNGIDCPLEVECPPRFPRIYYNGSTGLLIGPPVQDIADVNPGNGRRYNSFSPMQ